MNTEPVWTTAGITAGVAALIGLLVAFGLPITSDQQTAILGLVGVLAPVVVALFARSRVTPNVSVTAFESHGETVAGDASPIKTGAPVEVTRTADSNPVG